MNFIRLFRDYTAVLTTSSINQGPVGDLYGVLCSAATKLCVLLETGSLESLDGIQSQHRLKWLYGIVISSRRRYAVSVMFSDSIVHLW